jgi:sugar phosphate isomerase/epimerase
LIYSPQIYYRTTALIEECFALLGPYVKSCHAKDILLASKLTVHLDEVRPGLGGLDYRTFLREANRWNVPVMLEHLHNPEDYQLAAQYVRQVAAEIDIAL